jgi:hypothetical protein
VKQRPDYSSTACSINTNTLGANIESYSHQVTKVRLGDQVRVSPNDVDCSPQLFRPSDIDASTLTMRHGTDGNASPNASLHACKANTQSRMMRNIEAICSR